jgi:hypothetical protein
MHRLLNLSAIVLREVLIPLLLISLLFDCCFGVVLGCFFKSMPYLVQLFLFLIFIGGDEDD